MDQSILKAILQSQKMAFALIDSQLCILLAGGSTSIDAGTFGLVHGAPLLGCVPELAGSEAAIGDLLSGIIPQLAIEHLNRPQPDGTMHYYSLILAPYCGPDTRAALLLQISDTTVQSQMLQQLAQGRNELRLLTNQLAQRNQALMHANTELRRLDDVKSNFVAVAAHELRNPLTPILGYLELLLENDCGPLTAEQAETLRVVLKNVLRLRTIASDLLDLAWIESGRIELVLRPLDLHALVTMVGHEYQPQLAAKQQQLRIRAATPLPYVLGDETRMAQIIGNLLSNASKYTPPQGQISIQLAPGNEGFLELAIEDNGVGISPDDQGYLFNAFFRARAAMGTPASGTGLGLHITRLLVELHGGQIRFMSQPGQGSIFYVTFQTTDTVPAASVDLNMRLVSG